MPGSINLSMVDNENCLLAVTDPGSVSAASYYAEDTAFAFLPSEQRRHILQSPSCF